MYIKPNNITSHWKVYTRFDTINACIERGDCGSLFAAQKEILVVNS